MHPPAPTGTVTFLFTDIEGSTKRWEANPAVMQCALVRHDELMRAAIEGNGGHVFKTIGDAFCAAFSTAREAVAATLAAQAALRSEPWVIDPPVRARMALHTGSADERDGDYFGQPVNRVARLLSAGHGGQILVSLVTQELIRDALPSGCSLVDLGEASLKDLARPERVFQLNGANLPSDFPPLRTLNSGQLPNNLPQQPTLFIGRQKELAEIKTLLGGTRLLTLAGPGGAGKTRLALQAAADLLDGQGDGVWLVELAPIADGGLVAGEVIQTLGIKEQSGTSQSKSLVAGLSGKRLLIVLDNCEHLVDACARLAADILQHCPGVDLLATSREPLGVPGEQVYRIPNLSVPRLRGDAAPDTAAIPEITAASLSQYDSVSLFIERAKAVQPAFAVTDDNAPAVAQICAHLDGIPLALELAAARVRSLPIEQINARLDQRFRLLTGGARTLLPRQQTLKALIDWSYDLLTDQEKLLLTRFSVFIGGWTLAAAETICSGGEIEEWETLDLVTSLTDKSLVIYDGETQAGTGARYRLLESMRQYGGERSGEAEAAELKRRHRDFYSALASEARSHLSGADAAAWLARLDAEHDNLRAALAWCEREQAGRAEASASGSLNPPQDAFPLLQLASELAPFWQLRGYLFEGRYWLSKALPSVDLDPDESAGSDAGDLRILARALSGAGSLAYSQGDLAEATALQQRSLDIRRGLGDEAGIAGVLNSLGNIAFAQSAFPEARERYDASLAIHRKLNNESGIAGALGNLGLVLGSLGEHEAATPLLEEGLRIMRRRGDQRGVAVSLNNLGNALVLTGRRPESRSYFQESLQLARTIGDQRRVANALANLGSGATAEGDYPAALAFVREALEIRRDMGDQARIAQELMRMGDLAEKQQQTTQAVTLWSAALKLGEQIGTPITNIHTEENLENALASARAAIGDGAFEAATATGQTMSWEEAVAYALALPTLPSPGQAS